MNARGGDRGGRSGRMTSRDPRSTEPRSAEARTPGEWLAFHGPRLVLLLGLAVGVTVLFPPVAGMNVGRYEVGMVAPEDIIAEATFGVPKSPEELERERAQARETVSPTLDYRPEAADTMAAHLRIFFDRLERAARAGDSAGTDVRTAMEAALAEAQIQANAAQISALMDPDTRALLRRTALMATNQILAQGVIDGAQAEEITTETVTVFDGETERTVPAEDLTSATAFFAAAPGLLPPETAPDVVELLRLILIRNIEYTYALNVLLTEQDREAAASSVATTREQVLEGEAIVREADRIGAEQLARINAYEQFLRAQGMLEDEGVRLAPVVGSVLLHAMILAIFGLLVFFFRPEVYGNLRALILIALLVAAYFGAGAAISLNGLPAEWLPIAFVALPVGVLWDARLALVLVAVLAVLTGALPPFVDYGTVLVVLAGGAAAAMSVRAVRRRSQTWVSIAIIAGATGLVLFAHGLSSTHDMSEVLQGLLPVAFNATASALLAMGFLWVFELFTGITTDQSLLEWADPSRPLLRRLSFEAPGTYAHTIHVANLAEAGANAIGANGLLTRVGCYYHDVGKMLKPQYFVENQPDHRNPHDKLKPETSATIVREHVTEGARLARDAGVPEPVARFITEHHGTQTIGFFLEKAREEAEDPDALDMERFRYPGPKPQSKETAIVMLADSCESATRALKDPTYERIAELIDSVVDGKIAAGQLDEAPLTLREITELKEQFATLLSGVVHRRIEYPETKHLTDAPDEAEGPGGDAAGDGGESGDGPGPAPSDEPDRAGGSGGGDAGGEAA